MADTNHHAYGNGCSATICPMHPIEHEHLGNIKKCDRCYEVEFVRTAFTNEGICFICDNPTKDNKLFCCRDHLNRFIARAGSYPGGILPPERRWRG